MGPHKTAGCWPTRSFSAADAPTVNDPTFRYRTHLGLAHLGLPRHRSLPRRSHFNRPSGSDHLYTANRNGLDRLADLDDACRRFTLGATNAIDTGHRVSTGPKGHCQDGSRQIDC